MRNRKHGGKPVDERKNHRAEQKKTLGSGFQSAFRTLKLPARRGRGNCRRSVAWLRAEVHAKALMIEKLRAQLAVLRRARFGRKSEKLDAQVEQLELLIADIETCKVKLGSRNRTDRPFVRTGPFGTALKELNGKRRGAGVKFK